MVRRTLRNSRMGGQCALLIAGLLMMAAPAAAQGRGPATCTRPPGAATPVVRVVRESVPMTYRFDKSEAELKRLHPGGGDQPAGLTAAAFDYELRNVRYRGYKLADGRLCQWIENVELVLRLSKLDIYVAREYPRGSCQSRLVLEHENQHVAYHKQVMDPAAQNAEAALKRLLQQANPFVSPANEANRPVTLMVQAITPVLDHMRAEDRRLNAAIDTQDSYRQTWKRCP